MSTIKLLSVDDKSLTSDLDRAGYRKMGVQVRIVNTFDDIMGNLKKDQVDVIVMNLDFPKVDSISATKHLKSSRSSYADIPIVLTSVQDSAKVKRQALEAGADLFVEQPLPREYFIEKVKSLLEQQVRTQGRLEVNGDAHCKIGDREFSCPIGDLSVGGILVCTDEDLPAGESVELAFQVPDSSKEIRVRGEVVRRIEPSKQRVIPGVGIKFVDFRDDSQRRLERFVSKTTEDRQELLYYL